MSSEFGALGFGFGNLRSGFVGGGGLEGWNFGFLDLQWGFRPGCFIGTPIKGSTFWILPAVWVQGLVELPYL